MRQNLKLSSPITQYVHCQNDVKVYVSLNCNPLSECKSNQK